MAKGKAIDTGARGFTPEPKPRPPARGGPVRQYKVTVKYLKTAMIGATSPEEALEKYKLLNGMTATDHEPEIVEATEEGQSSDG